MCVWLFSLILMLLAAVNLPLSDPQVTLCASCDTADCLSKWLPTKKRQKQPSLLFILFLQFSASSYLWAVVHLCCVGSSCQLTVYCQHLCKNYLRALGLLHSSLGVYRVFKSHYKPSGLRWVSTWSGKLCGFENNFTNRHWHRGFILQWPGPAVH